MKVNIDNISGNIVKNSERYTVVDNTSLNSLVVSKTILHPEKETSGHSHEGQEEVYQFVHGHGRMTLTPGTTFFVSSGDVVLIEDGVFHKVYNDSKIEDLVFVCVFNGKRSH
jgi:mannose-6-phosphate isomerase-like protein (cupin superfamily)